MRKRLNEPLNWVLDEPVTMLKIGTVKWRGKCPRHPGFDPAIGGPAAIRGNCAKCLDLSEIYGLHQKTLQLMRAFRPLPPKNKAASPPVDDRQQSLFG